MRKGFQCGDCGTWHDELPLDVGFDEPLYVSELDDDQRARWVTGTGDFRELVQDDVRHYFIRGVIEIPIVGTDEVFCYGVWSSLSEKSYAAALVAHQNNESAGPFFGWLSNRLPSYPDTLNLKMKVHLRRDIRSALELEPTDHPLAVEQRNGMAVHRVEQIISTVMRPSA